MGYLDEEINTFCYEIMTLRISRVFHVAIVALATACVVLLLPQATGVDPTHPKPVVILTLEADPHHVPFAAFENDPMNVSAPVLQAFRYTSLVPLFRDEYEVEGAAA